MMASSDLSSLYYLLGNSLSTQEQLRKDAETQLETAAASNGFSVLLLQVTASSQTDIGVRQAAAVYFKNLINRRYDPYDDTRVTPLPEEDKAKIKSLLVSAVMESGHVVRPQLITATHKIIRADFPNKWPGLVDELYPLITGDNSERVISALAIFHEVVSWHGGTSTEESKEMIHGRVFPILLSILQSRMEAASNLDKDSMAIVKSILKSFHAAIQYRFSAHLLLNEPFTNWCTAITRVIQLTPPAEVISLSNEEADAHLYWKMKKWCFRIHNKIFQRYGCSKLDSFNNPDHMPFAKFYMEHVSLPVLTVYLSQIESNLAGNNPFNERIFCLVTDFLESAIRHKKTWSVLEKHALELVNHFMFPRVCFNEEDEEMWEDDPEEYVRVKLDPFDDIYSWQSSSVNFILDLIKCRKKSTFFPILQFINTTLSASTTTTLDVNAQRRKDGALFVLGSISRVLVASDLKGQIESVIADQVIPELTSSQGFLRMRSCWTLEHFDEIEYTEVTCLKALQGVLNCLTDKELPVRVAAASALAALLDNEAAQKALPPYLGKVMEAVLELANEIQLDSLSFVLERLIQMFADELSPYAVQLCTQLRDTVARHLEGYRNLLDSDDDDDKFAQNADKMMAVVGMFKAMETMIDSMGKTPELVAQMEDVVMPLLAMVLDRRIIDVYEEVFELIDSITYNRKQISPALWNLVPHLYHAFIDVGCDYIQDMQTTLDNIISYGSSTLLSNDSFLQMFLNIIQTTMTGEDFTENDRVYGCKLMESMMLNCRGQIDQYIGKFIGFVAPTITSQEDYSVEVSVHHLEVVINAIYYNGLLALQHLEGLNLTAAFFTLWFSKAEKFTRVHDKRLIIVSLSQLMNIPFTQLPLLVQRNWQLILPLYLSAIRTLPKALEERHRLEEEDPSSFDDASDYGFSEDDYEEVNDEVDDEAEAIKNALARKNRYEEDDFNDDDDGFEDVLEEELFFETPLDKIDISEVVKQSLASVAQNQPDSFQILTQGLDQEKSLFLQSILNA